METQAYVTDLQFLIKSIMYYEADKPVKMEIHYVNTATDVTISGNALEDYLAQK
jgi:hypothetical protein